MQKISIILKPNSKKGPLVEETENGLVLYVREQAIDGKANNAAVVLLAMHLNVAPSCVRLVSGQTARHKRFEILD